MFGQVSVVLFVIAILVVAIIAALVSCLITYFVYKNKINTKIGNAEDKAREILDEALKTAEAKKREGLLEIFLEAGAIVMNPNCSVCCGASSPR